MLLVEHDQAEIGDRREHGRARPDADARLALAQAPPLLVALPGRQPRVQHRDGLAEALDEAGHDLRRERDLGHQHDRAATLARARGGRAQVDLGLARAGHAVQQRLRSPLRVAQRLEHRLEHRLLVGASARAGRAARRRPRGGAGARPRGACGRSGACAAPGGSTRPARARTSSSTRPRSTRPARPAPRGTPELERAQRLEQLLLGDLAALGAGRRRRRAAARRPNGTTSIEPTPTSPRSSSGSR